MKESDVQLTHFVRDHIRMESSNHEASVPRIAAKEKKSERPENGESFSNSLARVHCPYFSRSRRSRACEMHPLMGS